jgi:hypothetical protein
MTNGPGKSDRHVVPEKSPNNAGQPAAEEMEGRGLAKGNLPQQNASRTPRLFLAAFCFFFMGIAFRAG